MKKIRPIAYLIFVLTIISFSNCLNSEDTITGKTLLLEYERYEELTDSAWIQIDDVTFIHTPHDFEWESMAFLPHPDKDGYFNYLPTSRVYHYFPGSTEKRFIEPYNNMNIMMNLSERIRSYNYTDNFKYINKEPTLLLSSGKLVLQRTDKKNIKLKHSENYPIKIEVLD